MEFYVTGSGNQQLPQEKTVEMAVQHLILHKLKIRIRKINKYLKGLSLPSVLLKQRIYTAKWKLFYLFLLLYFIF